MDPKSRLVAHAKYPVVIDKEALLRVTPEPWPSDDRRLVRFVRWLARRFDRPALPDELVEAFQKPIELVLAELEKQHLGVMAAFSRAFHEVRVNLPEAEEPPYFLQLVLIANQPRLTEEESGAVDLVMAAILEATDPKVVRLERQPRIVTEHEISWGEYLRTCPLYLEYYTYKGEEIGGAEPFPRA